MNPLHFKKEIDFVRGRTYSVCLRGARRYDHGEFDLSLYTPSSDEKPKELADIVSQQQFRFSDVSLAQCIDNYDDTAQTTEGLWMAMLNAYGEGFNDNEIVTILRFKVV